MQRVTTETTPNLYQEARTWLEDDWRHVKAALGSQVEAFRGTRILVTGAAGFLGFTFLHFFSYLNEHVFGAHPVTVTAADSYLRGRPRWIAELAAVDRSIVPQQIDITKPWSGEHSFEFIIHGACIASPTVYRQYPLDTLDTNVIGLRHMLELARHGGNRGLLFFSSSEIYGDPPAHEIPTREAYRGNVACLGPRACYDESKRVGETLCYLYAQQYGVSAKIVRPFNNYGPGLRLSDGRVLPDFCRDIMAGRDIVLYSDGKPTRTFCYASDALTGYLLALLAPYPADPFNIGCQTPEISMADLAALVLRLAGSGRRVVHARHDDTAYITDSPARRCPDISKAHTLLGFAPQVSLHTGIVRLLTWYDRFAAVNEPVGEGATNGRG